MRGGRNPSSGSMVGLLPRCNADLVKCIGITPALRFAPNRCIARIVRDTFVD
jgi:hypothetical protein